MTEALERAAKEARLVYIVKARQDDAELNWEKISDNEKQWWLSTVRCGISIALRPTPELVEAMAAKMAKADGYDWTVLGDHPAPLNKEAAHNYRNDANAILVAQRKHLLGE